MWICSKQRNNRTVIYIDFIYSLNGSNGRCIDRFQMKIISIAQQTIFVFFISIGVSIVVGCAAAAAIAAIAVFTFTTWHVRS